MPPTIFDETYDPRPWRCSKCKQNLGVVMRDANRIRRLWVFITSLRDSQMPTTLEMRNTQLRGIFRSHGVNSCEGVECSICGAMNEWSINEESYHQLVLHHRKLLPNV